MFLGGLAVLYVTGVLSTDAALAGFSNPGMVTVGVLYVVVTGLEQPVGWISSLRPCWGYPKVKPPLLVRLIFPVMGV